MLLDDALGPRRIELIERLKARGVGTSIYYPRPVPLMSYYQRRYGGRPGDFPVAESISDGSIALPVGPHVTLEDIEYIADSVAAAIAETT
jgi:dTDP-4-amino-4,6-dideoxygalactose transaminase